MATITIQINAGAQTYTHTKTVTGPHLVRFLAAYRTLLGQVPTGEQPEPGQPIPMRDMTDEETAAAWANGIFAGTKANIKRVEQTAASTTASAAVTEITLT